MTTRVVAHFAQNRLFISFFFDKFYKILDKSFHTKIFQFLPRRISSVN